MSKPFVTISLPPSEINKFRDWLKSNGDSINKDGKKIIGKTIRQIERQAKMLAPVNKLKGHGGFLRSSIHSVISMDRLGGAVFTARKYAPYQEWGTGKYIQVPSFVKESFGVDSMDWKGAGIRRVNIHPKPYLFSAAYIGYKNMIAELKAMGFKDAPASNNQKPKFTYRPDY
jgi:hypothetical protein